MHPTDFQREMLRTLSPTNRDLTQATLGLMDEVGELSKVVKNNRAQGHPLNMQNVAEELGDILYYTAMACHVCELSMSEVMDNVIAKLRRRYPEGFSADKSINRDVEAEMRGL